MPIHRILDANPTSDVRLVTVGISDYAVTADPGERLITYSLGSCVGVTVFDPEAGVGGMIHCMLPLSTQSHDPSKAAQTPAMFVDTGVLLLLNAVYARGAVRERLRIKVAGAANPMDTNGRFRIGERNHAVLRKILWKNDLMIHGESVGGTIPRTLILDVASGRTILRTTEGEVEL